MEYDHQADIAEVKHLNSCTGFLLTPNLCFYSKESDEKSTFEA